jgi:hypothetical protein
MNLVLAGRDSTVCVLRWAMYELTTPHGGRPNTGRVRVGVYGAKDDAVHTYETIQKVRLHTRRCHGNVAVAFTRPR